MAHTQHNAPAAATTTNVVRETDKKWLRGMLGGTSNAFAIILVSPLDVLKIRFQTQNALTKAGAPKTYDGILKGAVTIVSNEGVRGLFKGLSVSMLRELTFSSARMGLYEPIRNYLVGPGQKEIALGQKILAGLMSGAIAAAVFNPTDVLKTQHARQSCGGTRA
ncbi:carrier superfamily protein [Acanthamoeba castellanii str. Neff]|uniref:Carrier superfamily protein n=1 Tax=Acanthamoeba castellanii (strain ATCC 30010 / Neff) TaxID=1257118 RepID=L8GPD2_ACACF|nr:carrier superfamily protein [Acanthamoeba castellanii str. Neff]ELR14767.1 carrier superfamily protein [Acanthamoeba castellanii str. Neff]